MRKLFSYVIATAFAVTPVVPASAQSAPTWFLFGMLFGSNSGPSSSMNYSVPNQRMLIGGDYRQTWVIDWEKKLIVDGPCIPRDKAIEFWEQAYGDRPFIMNYLRPAMPDVDKYIIVRAGFASGWTCWYIKVRLTELSNTTD